MEAWIRRQPVQGDGVPHSQRGQLAVPATAWYQHAGRGALRNRRDGNPLQDLYTNAAAINPSVSGGSDGIPAGTNLKIPCNTPGTTIPTNTETYTGTAIDGCPAHLPVKDGQKYSAFDVAAWSDLWFYSNPVFIEVKGSTVVAGIN